MTDLFDSMPTELIKASEDICLWFAERNINKWALGGLQSRQALQAEREFCVLDLFKTGDGSYMDNGLTVTFKDGRLVAVNDFRRPNIDARIAEKGKARRDSRGIA